jgi:beta-glucosidase
MYNHEKCRKRAEDLVSQMTIDEKIEQLTYQSPAIERLGVPSYNWWNEALHGVARGGTATVFPQAIGMAATFDTDLLKSIAGAIATEARAKYNISIRKGDRDMYKGLTFWTPNVNIFRDPRWGRGHETYGEDPYLTSRLGVSFIQGLQGDSEVMKTSACAKHFAVHSGPEDMRHEFDAVVSEKDLRETYLPAFEACVKEADVESVMGAYNRTNGEVCCGSYRLLRDILRDEWGFKGHVVSDCWAIQDFHERHRVTKTPVESVALALDAGCDLNCGSMYLHLKSAWMQKLVSEAQITEAAVRLFTTRYKLGLFDETEYDKIPYAMVACKEHGDLSLKAAEESIVLLKNSGILPLDISSLKTIGVIGPNADSQLALKGNYYGTPPRCVTPLEAIHDIAGDQVRVMYSVGCELTADRSEVLALPDDRIAEALTIAEQSDVVVMFLGLDESLEGEELDVGNQVGSGDKKDLLLPLSQRQLLQKVTEVGTPVILCLMAGSSIDVEFADRNCGAVLAVWYPGARGGEAIANILFGKTNPSGKLPVTFYRSSNTLPAFTDYAMKGRTYRYMTEKPLYPFGYGLSYGEVKIKLQKSDSVIPEKGDFVFDMMLANDSDREVSEVIQVYIKAAGSPFSPPNPVLCMFKRVSIPAGGQIEVSLAIPSDSFSVIDEEGKRIRSAGEWEIYAGVSQPDARSCELTGNQPIKITVTA